MPLEVVETDSAGIRLRIVGVTDALAVDVLARGEVAVSVVVDGCVHDTLVEFDAVPLPAGEGVVCALCDPSEARVYASAVEMWRDHVLAAFEDWMAEVLSRASAIGLGQARGATWAALLGSDDEARGYTRTIPLRLPGGR